MARKRFANVVVQNQRGSEIRGVAVVHKYSNVYKDKGSWASLKDGARSSPIRVRYNTGALTTGRDWWQVAWVSRDGKWLYYTDPSNFRFVFDLFDQVAGTIGELAGRIVFRDEEGEESDWGGEAGRQIANILFNTEKTSGFKQHILRSKDAHPARATRIVLRRSEVEFNSPSGKSTTSGIKKKHIPRP